jgi:hypothetical protein
MMPRISPLLAWRSGEREDVEVKDDLSGRRRRRASLLGFDVFSRRIVFVLSMACWR